MPKNQYPSRNQKRQQKVQIHLERRRARERIANSRQESTENITNDMIEEELIVAKCKKISSALPLFHDKAKKIFARNSFGDNKQYAVGRAINAIPSKPLKKHVGWLSMVQQDAKSDLSLSEEIGLFSKYVGLTDIEEQARNCILSDMEEAVRVYWEDAEVVPFGSYAAGLSIYSSDIDAAILSQLAESWVLRQSQPNDSDNENDEELDRFIKRPRLGEVTSSGAGGIASLAQLQQTLLPSQPPTTTANASTVEAQKPTSKEAVEEEGEEEDDGSVVMWEISRTTVLEPPKPGQQQIGTVIPSVLGKRGRYDENDNGTNSSNSLEEGEVNEEDSGSSSDNSDDNNVCDNDDKDEDEETHTSDLYGIGEARRALLPSRIDLHSKPVSTSYKRFDETEEAESRAHQQQQQQQKQKDELPVDLDISVTHSRASNRQVSARSLPQSSLDFSNVIDLTGLTPPSRHFAARREPSDAKQRQRKIQILRRMSNHFRLMDWTQQIEFRHRAKVPIIHYTHRSGIESDVSLGLNEDDTLRLAQALVHFCGQRVLFELSSFLKVFLHQLQLDEPFSGVLGSFKLYVLLTVHCQRHPELLGRRNGPRSGNGSGYSSGIGSGIGNTSDNANATGTGNLDDKEIGEDEEEDEEEEEEDLANTGLLLLKFLQHFGRAANLNAFTQIHLSLPSVTQHQSRSQSQSQSQSQSKSASRICSDADAITVDVTFEVNTMIELVQRAFAVAYNTLRDRCRAKSQQRKQNTQQPQESMQTSDNEDEILEENRRETLNNNNNNKQQHHSYSHSLLAPLLVSCQDLLVSRSTHLRQTTMYLQQRGSETQRLQRAQLLLTLLQEKHHAANAAVSLAWHQCDRALQVRILSFVDPHRCMMTSAFKQVTEQAFADILAGTNSASRDLEGLGNLTDVQQLLLPATTTTNNNTNNNTTNTYHSEVHQHRTKKHRTRPKSLSHASSMSSLASLASQHSQQHQSVQQQQHQQQQFTPLKQQQQQHSSGGFGRHNIPAHLISSPYLLANNTTPVASPINSNTNSNVNQQHNKYQQQQESLRSLSSQIDASIAMLKEKLREKNDARRSQQQRRKTYHS